MVMSILLVIARGQVQTTPAKAAAAQHLQSHAESSSSASCSWRDRLPSQESVCDCAPSSSTAVCSALTNAANSSDMAD